MGEVLLVLGAEQLATPQGTGAQGGAQLGRLQVIERGGLAVRGERIVAVAEGGELERRFPSAKTLRLDGGTLVPGFVDAHTHPVFAGTREEEFELRTRGASYVDIAKAGGGILSSVRGVRAAGKEELLALLLRRLERFLELGTTTIEAKTGYGLTFEDELKCLEVIDQANRSQPVECVPTFLGAHDYPPEFRERPEAYVDLLVEDMLPRIAETGLARYCDIFTESHVFGLDDSRRILERARELGFGLRLHVDQLSQLGGAQLAADLGAASADHLEYCSAEGIEALAEARVVPVLCPLVPLYLRIDQEAPARRMIDAGLAPALATDFNPGSCMAQSLAEVMSFGALRYSMSAEECLNAVTLNAAASLSLADERGSLEVGKRADFVHLDQPNYRHLCYELTRNPVRTVAIAGKVAFER
ncbi:MAG: imidazolonepropionase [Planctomycetes bacterium]|jgi:imidazolonepropionase|nr:imidazolonepropionase [Planctomycetota bacterium]